MLASAHLSRCKGGLLLACLYPLLLADAPSARSDYLTALKREDRLRAFLIHPGVAEGILAQLLTFFSCRVAR